MEFKKWQAGQLSLAEKPCSVWKKLMKSVRDRKTRRNDRFKSLRYLLLNITTTVNIMGETPMIVNIQSDLEHPHSDHSRSSSSCSLGIVFGSNESVIIFWPERGAPVFIFPCINGNVVLARDELCRSIQSRDDKVNLLTVSLV